MSWQTEVTASKFDYHPDYQVNRDYFRSWYMQNDMHIPHELDMRLSSSQHMRDDLVSIRTIGVHPRFGNSVNMNQTHREFKSCFLRTYETYRNMVNQKADTKTNLNGATVDSLPF